jgi:hypothetical protein
LYVRSIQLGQQSRLLRVHLGVQSSSAGGKGSHSGLPIGGKGDQLLAQLSAQVCVVRQARL